MVVYIIFIGAFIGSFVGSVVGVVGSLVGLSGDSGDVCESSVHVVGGKDDGESIDGSLVLSGCESETISMVESSSVGSGLSSSDGSIRLSVGESVW